VLHICDPSGGRLGRIYFPDARGASQASKYCGNESVMGHQLHIDPTWA
jgi:hypothetical protein